MIAALLAVAALLAAPTGHVRPASAAVFAVTKTADTADGACDADCSLREAIIAANAALGVDTITLAADTYNLSIAGTGENAAATGDLDFTDDAVLQGAGVSATVIDGQKLDRVLHVVAASADVTMKDL